MKNSFLYTVIFTFVLSFVFVLVLSFTNAFTANIIETNSVVTQQRAILIVLGIDETEIDSKAKVKQRFADVQEVSKGDNTYYSANFTGVSALAKQFTGPGLWGIITGYIAFSEDVSRVIGFEVTDQNETPGLGGRVTEQWFTDQFRNEQIVDDRIIVGNPGTGDENKDNGSIDGISGATRTSDGVQSILDKEIAVFKKDLNLSYTPASNTDTSKTNSVSVQQDIGLQRAILITLGMDEAEVDNDTKVKQKFADVQEVSKGNNTYYAANFTGIPALAKQFEGQGLWGAIIGYIAFSEDLTHIIGFEVTNHKETPNLGGRMTEPWFTEQFRNEKIVDGRIIVGRAGNGDKNKDNGSIDGISGATRTSEGIQSILDKAIAVFEQDFK